MGVKNQKMRKQKMRLNLNDENKYVVHMPFENFTILPEAWVKIQEDA